MRAFLLLFWLVAAAMAHAQELEPRAYSPSPVGTNFLVLAYVRTTGDVVFDPALPFSDVSARLHTSTTSTNSLTSIRLRLRQPLISVII